MKTRKRERQDGDRKTYTEIFKHKTFIIIGFDSNDYCDLAKIIKDNGAHSVATEAFSLKSVSYIICNCWNNSYIDIQEKKDQNCLVVTKQWVFGSLQAQKCLDPKHLLWYQPPTMGWNIPSIYEDTWDDEHLKLPCSLSNTFNGHTPKWPYICSLLSVEEFTVQHFVYALQHITGRKNSFPTLVAYIEVYLHENERAWFLSHLLPAIAKLALDLPTLCIKPIPLLLQGRSECVTLSQIQVGSLLANSLFCTFPNASMRQFPRRNMEGLYLKASETDSKVRFQKLRAIFNYFARVSLVPPRLKQGNISYIRLCKDTSESFDLSQSLDVQFSPAIITDEGTIEDNGNGMLQADFANRYVGGGVLGNGCVQEEIRFLINPELIFSCMITEVLADHEALLVVGTERYSRYTGYGDSFVFAGNFIDKTECDELNRLKTEIIAFDALAYPDRKSQYSWYCIKRELIKALVAFSCGGQTCGSARSIATGNWGCGVFRGDPQLKFLIQWIAASVSHKELVYFTFRDSKLKNVLNEMRQCIVDRKWKVDDLIQILVDLSSNKSPKPNAVANIILFAGKGTKHKEYNKKQSN